MLAEKWDVDLLRCSLVKNWVRGIQAHPEHSTNDDICISIRFLFKLDQIHHLILDRTTLIWSDKLSTCYILILKMNLEIRLHSSWLQSRIFGTIIGTFHVGLKPRRVRGTTWRTCRPGQRRRSGTDKKSGGQGPMCTLGPPQGCTLCKSLNSFR